jgi:hypothetical protein
MPVGSTLGNRPRSEYLRGTEVEGLEHRDLVIATHGMVMTLWLISAPRLDDAVWFWDDVRSLGMFRADLSPRTATSVSLVG